MPRIKRPGYLISGALLTFIVVLGNACEKIRSKSPASLAEPTAFESFSAGISEESADRTVVTYVSRSQVMCAGRAEPDLELEKEVASEHFQILKRFPMSDGSCRLDLQATDQVVEFYTSQLAAFEGRLVDKKTRPSEVRRDNRKTRIVCQIEKAPVPLLENQLRGVVVLQSDQSRKWISRLDFSVRSDPTSVLFDDPPEGELVQTRTSLEFRTRPRSEELNRDVIQLVYVKIARPHEHSLSPSLDYGRRIYPGFFQYYYADPNQAPALAISTAAVATTCFVDQIPNAGLEIDFSGIRFDLVTQLLEIYK